MDGRLLLVFVGIWISYRLACWIADRAHRLGTGAAGAVLGSAHAPVPARSSCTTNHEIRRREA